MTCLLLAACSSSHDGWFANPCPNPLTIRTFYSDREIETPTKSDEMIAEATLRPNAVTKVEDAFQDANGFTWFIEVVGGPTIQRSKQEMPKWFVALPATVCAP